MSAQNPVAEIFRFEDGSYVKERWLGKGRFGEVWAVRSEREGIRRAAKVVAEKDRVTLETEWAILTELAKVDQQQFIVRAYGIGQAPDGRPALLMDLVEGTPLSVLAAERMKGNWTLQAEIQCVRLATQIARLLGVAYSQGIALTDLKPDNFFLYNENGRQRIRVIDWNVVEQRDYAQAFINKTLPRLTALLYELFTGVALVYETIDGSKLGTEVGRWDELTYETQAILYDLAEKRGGGNNPALAIEGRWEEHLRFMEKLEAEEERLKWKEIVCADELEAKQKGWSPRRVLTACEALLLHFDDRGGTTVPASFERGFIPEERQLYWTKRRVSEQLDTLNFEQALCDMQEPNRRYADSPRKHIPFRFLRVMAELGLAAKSNKVSYEIYLKPFTFSFDYTWASHDYERGVRTLRNIYDRVVNWEHVQQALPELEELISILHFYEEQKSIEQLLLSLDQDEVKKLLQTESGEGPQLSLAQRVENLERLKASPSRLTSEYLERDVALKQAWENDQSLVKIYYLCLKGDFSTADIELKALEKVWHSEETRPTISALGIDIHNQLIRKLKVASDNKGVAWGLDQVSIINERIEGLRQALDRTQPILGVAERDIQTLLRRLRGMFEILDSVSAQGTAEKARLDAVQGELGELTDGINEALAVCRRGFAKAVVFRHFSRKGDALSNYKRGSPTGC
jgi:Protein kinase domain